ncbi:MAG: class I SAM-dependent methyltransferase [Candidatus Margulisiibacteriota bacterium]
MRIAARTKVNDLSGQSAWHLICPGAMSVLYQRMMWDRMPERGRVLEIGAGCGAPLQFYTAEQRGRVTALDIDGRALKTLKKTYPEVETLVCDIRDIKAESSAFSACIGSNALYLATSEEQLAGGFFEIDRILSDNGRIAHIMSGLPANLLEDWSPDNKPDPSDPESYWRAYQKISSTMVKLLKASGYRAHSRLVRTSVARPLEALNDVQRQLLPFTEELYSGFCFDMCFGVAAVSNPSGCVPEGYYEESMLAYVLFAQRPGQGTLSSVLARIFDFGRTIKHGR